jgi:tRNA pseudouridine32 synthase/23S rRNA pseudouridine746 synthase
MGIAKRPSCVSLPDASKPYPTILSFLVQRFPKVSHALWEQRIADHKVIDDAGSPITMATPYLPQKRIYYFREITSEPSIPLQEKILYQNDEILVACKPPFLPVTPSGPYVNECLLNRLLLKTGNSDIVPLHRIDRETSGLVLFSMNKKTRGRYAELFSKGHIEKIYEALSELTQCPERREWTVENRLGRADVWFRNKVTAGPVNARSKIRLVEYEKNRARFLLYPTTGKKHQLRIHMSGLGFRIMHDRYYPALLDKQEDDLSKPLQLTSRRVKFTDPISGQVMEFESERQLAG